MARKFHQLSTKWEREEVPIIHFHIYKVDNRNWEYAIVCLLKLVFKNNFVTLKRKLFIGLCL